MEDVIGVLRRSLAVIGGAAYTIYSILGITAAVYFPVIKHYSVVKFSFGNFIQHL